MTLNRSIVIHRLGESFRSCTRIVEDPMPEPGPGEVLIRNHYAGVNGVYDQMMCLDRVEHTRVTPPAAAGVEAVGRVIATGPGVSRLAAGDAVATVQAGRGYRHYQVCHATDAIPVPTTEPWVLGIIPSGVSALIAMEQVARLGSGETVCITAAAGGLGNMLTQLALAADNHVIAVCGNETKARWLLGKGVHRVIQYRDENLDEVIRSEYRDALDLVMDSVGGTTFDTLVDNLAPHGRLVVCGYTSDRLPTERVCQERLYTRLYWKAASVRGFMNYRFSRHAPQARERLFHEVKQGRLDCVIDRTPFRGLEAVADAVEHLLSGANLGKVVVDLRP